MYRSPTCIMLEVKCGLYKSFGPEVWIPDSRHLPSGKIALSFNQKRTLFSVWVMHVEFHHLWSAFPLNIIDQNQRKKIRKHLSWKAFRLESIFVSECSLWFFFTEEECCAHSGRLSLTFERNMPDTDILFCFSAEMKIFPFSQSRCAVRRTVAL